MSDNQKTLLLEGLAKAIDENGTLDPTGLEVPSAATAYDVQTALFERKGVDLKGFKLSLRDGTLYHAPMFFVETGTEYPFVPGMMVEAEIALTLGRDIAQRSVPYTREEIVDAISSVALGIELVRSRFATPATFPLGLADLMSNVGYLVGPELDRAALAPGADFGKVFITADGDTLYDAPAKHPDNDPIAALLAYANSTPGPICALTKGCVVTTGSLCGGVPVPSASKVHIAVGGTHFDLTLAG